MYRGLRAAAIFLTCWSFGVTPGSAAPKQGNAASGPGNAGLCVQIFHDEVSGDASGHGPIHAVFLGNLLGHWPQYELRIRPVLDYGIGDLNRCKANFYIGTASETQVPKSFLADFFRTTSSVAWLGYGTHLLGADRLARTFGHRPDGLTELERDESDPASRPEYFSHVVYKDSVFRKDVQTHEGSADGEFTAVLYQPVNSAARKFVLADLVHSERDETTPYFLRAGNRFLVADIPFTYMHEGGRYFAFADLLFDILKEKPKRKKPLAFARMEDIHGHYDVALLKAAIDTLNAESVPVAIATIPLFMDPAGAYGLGKITTPSPSHKVKAFARLIRDEVLADRRNTLIWHGVTHQLGDKPNPYSGTSGDDYEFWNATAQKPIDNDTYQWTADRLSMALPVLKNLGGIPRYWVTPHYRGSAVSNTAFGDVFPWIIGRVTYYPSSFNSSFIVPARPIGQSLLQTTPNRQKLKALGKKPMADIDRLSQKGLGQLFPFEIYRDLYGQRIIPETLGYIAHKTSEQTPFLRTTDIMLGDAQRMRGMRDYWASFFFHPYIFAKPEDDGGGRFHGDTTQLHKLIIGLKKLGYQFASLPEFEKLAGTVTKGR